MPLGPVFNAELLTTARRARYYVIRFLYGAIILFQIYLTYESNTWRFGNAQGQLRIKEMADFGRQMFYTFAIVQAVVVIVLTPALVGGTIADERQRKTLHYLLTSQLSSAEIILSKLGARLLLVGVLVALGLPVVSLIGLFGGVDFQALFLSYAATMTTIFFVGSASILVSVVSRKPREAIALIYVWELVWLIVPPLIMNLMPHGEAPWPQIAEWVNPVLQYVALTSPMYFAMPMSLRSGGNAMLASAFWCMGLQLAYGAFFIVLAAIKLRPSARNEGHTSAATKWFARVKQKRRWFPRPACGDDAMLWKELHVARTGGLTKVAYIALGLILVGVIGYFGFEFVIAAVDEMWRDGYFANGRARSDLNGFLRGFGAVIYILWFLGVASASATGLCSEREEDQWLALTSTPLSGHEILRAKMLGPIWGFRMVAYLLFSLMGVGLVVGSIHPLGVVACLIEFAVFTWFLTSIGTFFSLRAKNSTRSLASTMALLIFLNGGYMFCCIPFQPDTPAITAGSTPIIFTISMLSVEDLGRLNLDRHSGEMVAAAVLCVLFYGVAAAGLTATVFSSFDTIVDRPDRFRQNRTISQQQEYLKGQEKELQHVEELM